MKGTRTRKALAALLCAIALTLTGCGEKKQESSGASDNSGSAAVVSDAGAASSTSTENPESAISSVVSSAGAESSVVSSNETSSADEPGAGLWSGAKYTEDTEIGSGAHSVLITVTIDGKSVVITVKSDKDNLAEMLVEAGLVEGDESEYGLYIKRVNGVLADYDVDQSFWNLLQNGTPTAVGASSITVTDGDAYELAYTIAE